MTDAPEGQNDRSLVLACSADDGFALPLAMTLFSALSTLEKGAQVSIYVLDGGIADARKKRIEQVLRRANAEVSIAWRKPGRSFEGLPAPGHLNQTAYMRLALPEVLPDSLDRVIYLDGDLLIEADLMELWRQEMGDHLLLAVQDSCIPYVSSPWSGLQDTYNSMGFAVDTPYFNTGVMVLHLGRWRSEGIAPAVVEFQHTNGQSGAYPIRVVYRRRYFSLEEQWLVLPQ